MKRELRADEVARRLDELRAAYIPERDEQARRRLQRERPKSRESFEQAVARRLEELRALCDLADYLHRVR